jgi:hypothetical protein
VTLAHLRRLLAFVLALPAAGRDFSLDGATLTALQDFSTLLARTDPSAVDDAVARRSFLDEAGALLDVWRASAYAGGAHRHNVRAPAGLLTDLARRLLPLVDATLRRCRRDDGLYDSYNLVSFTPGRAELGRLYPMLEGQVALLSCGLLGPAEAVELLDTLFASPLYTAERRSFLLYPDRRLPGFFERNRLDAEALALARRAAPAGGRS